MAGLEGFEPPTHGLGKKKRGEPRFLRPVHGAREGREAARRGSISDSQAAVFNDLVDRSLIQSRHWCVFWTKETIRIALIARISNRS
jgi:hypothetical protein